MERAAHPRRRAPPAIPIQRLLTAARIGRYHTGVRKVDSWGVRNAFILNLQTKSGARVA